MILNNKKYNNNNLTNVYNKQEKCSSRQRASLLLNVTPPCPVAFFVWSAPRSHLHTLGHAASLGMVCVPSAGRRGGDRHRGRGSRVGNSADAAHARSRAKCGNPGNSPLLLMNRSEITERLCVDWEHWSLKCYPTLHYFLSSARQASIFITNLRYSEKVSVSKSIQVSPTSTYLYLLIFLR